MNGEPVSALALAVLPYGPEEKVSTYTGPFEQAICVCLSIVLYDRIVMYSPLCCCVVQYRI
jgi:hypothetical protein